MALVPCQVLRVAILLSYCSILCNYKAIEMPSHQTYGGSWKFLTFIDLILLLANGSDDLDQERPETHSTPKMLSRAPTVGSICSSWKTLDIFE
ncbi:androgen-induced gene 1 protein isoform X8 [Bubalus bubalis]|uniref:androgen-induced gene 1 protein isoform X8 n=1 Tax=Bubalus bubalis TaxID=89462 RepID=UPI001E1B8631|nr:androgen-induced gene 1 protein isoform X8 [Bubalus bubalis]